MSKIRIKNFGPIRLGCQENEGWLDIKKVTVFIGNQGSGKSTIAKLISTFMWIEKALIRGDIDEVISGDRFLECIKFHRIEHYIEPNTEIEYEGETYRLKLVSTMPSIKQAILATRLNQKGVTLPKIMYVPAERNFLSSIENLNKLSNLVVGSLLNYSVEYRNAQLMNKGKSIDLPINDTKVVYDSSKDENYLEFGDKRLKLSHASSGFHSIVPLYWVTKYLSDFVKQSENILLKSLSPDQTIRRNNELKALNNTLDLDEKGLKAKEKKINGKYVCKYLVNIVEEPEQNLFPSSQQTILNSLLHFNNRGSSNKLIMTTHSPYLINYLSLAVKANELKKTIKQEDLKRKLDLIVPSTSTVDSNELVIYELEQSSGTINKLASFEGIPSDKNYLNQSLARNNQLYDSLLEIEEDSWQ